MSLAAVKAAVIAHALTLGHMHTTLRARQHALRLVETRRLVRTPGLALHTLQGTAHPPDTAKHQQENQQITHNGMQSDKKWKRSLPRSSYALPDPLQAFAGGCKRGLVLGETEADAALVTPVGKER